MGSSNRSEEAALLFMAGMERESVYDQTIAILDSTAPTGTAKASYRIDAMRQVDQACELAGKSICDYIDPMNLPPDSKLEGLFQLAEKAGAETALDGEDIPIMEHVIAHICAACTTAGKEFSNLSCQDVVSLGMEALEAARQPQDKDR